MEIWRTLLMNLESNLLRSKSYPKIHNIVYGFKVILTLLSLENNNIYWILINVIKRKENLESDIISRNFNIFDQL